MSPTCNEIQTNVTHIVIQYVAFVSKFHIQWELFHRFTFIKLNNCVDSPSYNGNECDHRLTDNDTSDKFENTKGVIGAFVVVIVGFTTT